MKFSLLSEIIIWKEKSVSLRYTIGLIVIDIFITTKYPVSLIKYMICYYHIKYKFNNSTIIHILYYCSGSDTLSYFFICKLHFVQDIVFKWPSKIYIKYIYIYIYIYTATCKNIRTFWFWKDNLFGFIMLQTRVE